MTREPSESPRSLGAHRESKPRELVGIDGLLGKNRILNEDGPRKRKLVSFCQRLLHRWKSLQFYFFTLRVQGLRQICIGNAMKFFANFAASRVVN